MEVGGRVRDSRARWKSWSECLGRGQGCVGAVKTPMWGGLRQMSVPRGEVRVNRGMVEVVIGKVIVGRGWWEKIAMV